MGRTKWTLVILILLLGWGCTSGSGTLSLAQGVAIMSPSDASPPEPEQPTGLQFRLSEGAPPPAEEPLSPPAQATSLPTEQVTAILSRLPELPATAEDEQPFALPEESLPPPRAGETVDQPFPPPAPEPAPTTAPAEALTVLRYSPEGDVPVAPYVSVTFSQPMVPLTAHQTLSETAVPVKVSPLPSGTWRWVGTQTLLFEPDGRFPMATEYTVSVPAGTRSAIGGELTQEVTWRFRTPPPQVTQFHPSGGPVRRDPLIFVAFDQAIEPDAVLPTIQATAAGKAFALRLASEDEIQADPTVNRLAREAEPGRWLAFRSIDPFPADTTVTVSIGPGTPSAEGPRRTEAAQRYTFVTYGPLVVVEHGCSWGDECPPTAPWFIRFSNPLDESTFDPAMVKVTPEVPGLRIDLYGDTLQLRGLTRGRTTYEVSLSPSIPDQFGQTLGKEVKLTFQVGSAPQSFYAPGDNLVVVDPSASRPTYSVYTVNYSQLAVKIYAVSPDDWPRFLTWQRDFYRLDTPPAPPGRLVYDELVAVEANPDELTETAIDLSPALTDGVGHAIVIVEPQVTLLDRLRNLFQRGPEPSPVFKWVQVTHLALDVASDAQQMVAWVNRLDDGAPAPNVQLRLEPGGITAVTGADGTATLPLPKEQPASYLVAQSGNDTALLPSDGYWWRPGGWIARTLKDELRWYVFDDRAMYRPGEEVHVKGWVRLITAGPHGDVALPASPVKIAYQAIDPQGNEIASGSVQANALGGFDLALTLPEAVNLGYVTLEMRANVPETGGVSEYDHLFQVQEFRRPEFEVTAQASEGPHFVGEYAIVSATARYYAGGGLPNAEVTWNVSAMEGHYAPPGWDDFVFGRWTPWWVVSAMPAIPWEGPTSFYVWPEGMTTYTGRTDASGTHRLRIDFDAVNPPQPMTVRAEATIMDINRQAWTASASLLVHPASLYVGLRTERMFVEAGQPLTVEAIVTDLDGQPIPGQKITMRAVRLDWAIRQGRWQEVEEDEQLCEVSSAEEPVSCTFKTSVGGQYRITATVRDERERANETQITRWVSGGKRPPSREIEQETVELIPDRESYQPGDVAEILVQAPFYPAEGLLTLRRSGLLSSQRFTMDGPTYTLRIPIEEGYIPNVHVQVDLVGATARADDQGEPDESLPPRPAFASGSLDLSVPPWKRTLTVEATPRDRELPPGGETAIDITVRDAGGEPVADAEVAVVVVDEAILALTRYQLTDPLDIFYSHRSPDTEDDHSRSYVLLVSPTALAADAAQPVEKVVEMRAAALPMPMAAAPTAAMEEAAPAAGAGEEAPIRVRVDFNPLAVFAPAVRTDEMGRAEVAVKLPDTLTRYRVMAVAVAGEKAFGKAESSITARMPLMVRPSPPRFLNFGDRFEFPVVLQNQTDEPLDVDVALRVTNLTLTSAEGEATAAGLHVTVPARDRVEVRFPAMTRSAGTARYQVAAVSGPWADAAQGELPVWTPATTEAFATYGALDEGAIVQPVIAPTGVFTQFGGLEITTSSTALQELTDAFLYLTSYPFECAEQLASRILAVAALRDVLTAFNAEGLPPAPQINAAVQRDIQRLQGMQNDDGGFPLWKRGEESWPFVSVHVAHALQRARAKDYPVPEEMLIQARQYLRDIERHIPSWYGLDARRTIVAYSLYVRRLMGDSDPAKAIALIDEAGLERLSPETLGWLYGTLVGEPTAEETLQAIRRHLGNRVVETAGEAHFVTSYREEDGYVLMSSNRRADGIILEALIADQPQSDLIPKIVRGLLAHRTRGRWSNTQENVFILLALDRYFNTYEAVTPDFVARVWLGEQYAGASEFRGRTTEYQRIRVPMSYLAQAPGEQPLILSKEGEGRLYYRLGIRYAPSDLWLEPADHGFTVERTYQPVDDPDDVWRDEDGVWHIKAGARVRVKLTMVATSRRYHVALVDPLPAGLEALNPALAVTGSVPADPQSPTRRYWWWSWYQHENLRDERAEAFTPLLWDGIYTYSYVARATTPGRFIVPPAKAEEMYAPETFGRSASDVVIVE